MISERWALMTSSLRKGTFYIRNTMQCTSDGFRATGNSTLTSQAVNLRDGRRYIDICMTCVEIVLIYCGIMMRSDQEPTMPKPGHLSIYEV
jgi:hypothetical protein